MHIVDVSFRVVGQTVPLAYQYPLYSAVSRIVLGTHEEWFRMHPLRGLIWSGPEGKEVYSVEKNATLCFRVPLSRIQDIFKLVGSSLHVGLGYLTVGTATVRPITPSENLASHAVLIKTRERDHSKEAFTRALSRKLESAGIQTDVEVGPSRRITIKGRHHVAYRTHLFNLSEEDSLKVQRQGLGGKQSMCCGIFTPSKR